MWYIATSSKCRLEMGKTGSWAVAYINKPTCPWKASIMNCRAWGWTHSIHFCTTWLPFWSLTHFNTWPSSSRTMSLWSKEIKEENCHKCLCVKLKVLITKQNSIKWKKEKWNLTYNYLLVWGNGLQGFLNDPATIHLQSQGKHVSTDTCCQSQLLVCTSKLHNTNSSS